LYIYVTYQLITSKFYLWKISSYCFYQRICLFIKFLTLRTGCGSSHLCNTIILFINFLISFHHFSNNCFNFSPTFHSPYPLLSFCFFPPLKFLLYIPLILPNPYSLVNLSFFQPTSANFLRFCLTDLLLIPQSFLLSSLSFYNRG
jgi:hypothetical protein